MIIQRPEPVTAGAPGRHELPETVATETKPAFAAFEVWGVVQPVGTWTVIVEPEL